MKRPLLFACLLALVASTLAPATTVAQLRDSVEVIEMTGNGPYQCCMSLNVMSRQRRPASISEFHMRILSGRASFVPGSAASPRDWTVFVANDLMSVAWF